MGAKILKMVLSSKLICTFFFLEFKITKIISTFALGSEEKYRTDKEAFAIISR